MLAVFFVLALSSSSATTELVIEDKFAEYSHDSPSFTVQYPKEWVKRSGEDSEVLFVSSLEFSKMDDISGTVFNIVSDVALFQSPS